MPTFCKRTSPAFARSCLRNEVVMKCLAWVAARSSERAVAAPPDALKMLLRAYLQFIARLARSASQVAESCRRSEANVVDMLRAVSKISVATSRVIREMSQGKEVPFLQMPTAPVDASIILYQVPPLFAADFALSIADQPELFVPSIGKLPAGSASSLAFDRLFQAGTRFLHAVQKDLLMVHLSRQQDADLESRNQEDSHFSFLPGQEDIEKAKALTADPLLPLLQKKVISHELGCSIRRISLRILHTMWAEILGHVTTVYLSETPVPPGHQISGDHLPTSIADKVQRRCDGLIAYMSFHSPTLPQSYTYLPSLETLVTDKASAEMHDRFSHLDVAVRDRMDLQMQLPQLMNSVPSLVPITSLPPDG